MKLKEGEAMGERIKELRKALGLTQQEFAEKLRIKRNTIAKYETRRGEPIDAVISLICREFNVNESWLRTGEGEMFIQLPKEYQLLEWAGKALSSDPDSFKIRFVKMLMSLTEAEWELLERKARELVSGDDVHKKRADG
ncbi:helix-turn-helix domain-containing protein [Ligaoa zhengdingensis]|uniref:helix-turn-helix domain-containing protein n=1 Tax=Ligaoa zhengdingensis TaxID=2763658 RepID=UPI0031BB769D